MNDDVGRLHRHDCGAWLLVALNEVAVYVVDDKVDKGAARLHRCWVLDVQQLPRIADQSGGYGDECDADFVAVLLFNGDDIYNETAAIVVAWQRHNNQVFSCG